MGLHLCGRALVAGLSLSGCGMLFEDFANPPPQPAYVSTCGAKFYSVDWVGYQEAESRAVVRMGVMCESFHNLHVSADHPENWYDTRARAIVGGLSGCDQAPGQNGWMEVLTDWHALSFFHECAHRRDCPSVNYDHEGWGYTDGGCEPNSVCSQIQEAAK